MLVAQTKKRVYSPMWVENIDWLSGRAWSCSSVMSLKTHFVHCTMPCNGFWDFGLDHSPEGRPSALILASENVQFQEWLKWLGASSTLNQSPQAGWGKIMIAKVMDFSPGSKRWSWLLWNTMEFQVEVKRRKVDGRGTQPQKCHSGLMVGIRRHWPGQLPFQRHRGTLGCSLSQQNGCTRELEGDLVGGLQSLSAWEEVLAGDTGMHLVGARGTPEPRACTTFSLSRAPRPPSSFTLETASPVTFHCDLDLNPSSARVMLTHTADPQQTSGPLVVTGYRARSRGGACLLWCSTQVLLGSVYCVTTT